MSSTINSTSASLKSSISSLGASIVSWVRSGTILTRATSMQSDCPTIFELHSDPDVGSSSSGLLDGADKEDLDKVSKALIFAVSGERSDSPAVDRAAKWFIEFLESKCKEAWNHIFRPVLEPGDPIGTGATDVNLCRAFRVFRTVALTTRDVPDIALSDLVDAVYNEENLSFIDEDRWQATVMVFTAFGWLCKSTP